LSLDLKNHLYCFQTRKWAEEDLNLQGFPQ
jgi:hypothetical protein